jgi:hypothetical protein
MTRRRFVAGWSSLMALAPSGAHAQPNGTTKAERELYELRRYRVRGNAQRTVTREYLERALVPALGRAGLSPIGVFDVAIGDPATVVLIPHRSAESVVALSTRLAGDGAYRDAAKPFLEATAERPPHERVDSSLLLAFEGMPRIEVPDTSRPRVFELRRYEQPSDATSLKKIEMFNSAGELPLFRRVGLTPVFFGQTIVGARMPNFEYLLVFESLAEREARWNVFRADPEWKKLSSREEYLDSRIMSGIAGTILNPAPFSQI